MPQVLFLPIINLGHSSVVLVVCLRSPFHPQELTTDTILPVTNPLPQSHEKVPYSSRELKEHFDGKKKAMVNIFKYVLAFIPN